MAKSWQAVGAVAVALGVAAWLASGRATGQLPGGTDDGLLARMERAEETAKRQAEEIAQLKKDNTQFQKDNAALQKALGDRITALEQYFAGGSDHAVIRAGLQNAGGKTFHLLLTPDGSLVLRRNNPADPKGWDNQQLVYKFK